MEFETFLTQVIDDGIEAVKSDYTRPDQADKRDGSIAGFEACRGKSVDELAVLLDEARETTRIAYLNHVDNYWYIRCYEAEVEWVCNCVSACQMNQGQPIIVAPTARGLLKAAEIVGVRGITSHN